MPSTRTTFRTCPLCEAMCGLEIEVERDAADGAERVRRIRGDRDDVFSRGFICPKGSSLKQLHEDPDRLRRPLVRRDGELVEVSWEEAFAEVERLWAAYTERHGQDGIALYLGNPVVHSLDLMLFRRPLLKALGSTAIFTAATVDQRPKELSSALMFGLPLTIAVPDIDRTDHLLMLGANPLVSNGSLATAADWPGRLAAIRERAGKVTVVDPRRTETAAKSDEWVPIRPGGDALLLAAMATTLFEEGLVDLGRLGDADLLAGVDEVREAVARFTPEAVAGACGIDAPTIRRLARELAAAERAVVYGRIGTTAQRFGTTASWLIDVLNALTANLDEPGGAMFPAPAIGGPNLRGRPGVGRGFSLSSKRSRVSQTSVQMGEHSAGVLAEEIDTPGPGQVRALFTLAGNPVLSVPNSGGRLDAALDGLDLMISVDLYCNETTRHADVILPPPSSLQRSHYDVAFTTLSVRNIANWSPPVLDRDDGQPAEWEILARLAAIIGGSPEMPPEVIDDQAITSLAKSATQASDGPYAGRHPEDVVAELGDRRGPDRLLDLMLRTGPYALSVDDLEANPHGVDLGALEPRLPDALRTASGKVELAPDQLLADLDRLAEELDATPPAIVLVGRRHLRSNNSWMGNLDVLTRGRERCTLMVHPDDAAVHGLTDGAPVVVRSSVGEVTVPAEVTDTMAPGVVSLPHGHGHDLDGVRLRVGRKRPGANSNLLADGTDLDPLSGTAALNGIAVELTPAPT
ncbi:MAG: molybdopterin-dependent oxidoreductase [Actinomycetota bacterium]|nr:molybdopterin-dependent oxidoreductase [Actinomycetota bacterium]